MSRTRLSREKWITAGRAALADHGPTALAAEPLSRALKTTKGSFYWHFKDVPAFQQAVIAQWQADALQHVVEQLGRDDSADQRLRQFGNMILADRAEPQLRIWAQHDGDVRAVLAEVDEERLNYITRLLAQLGLRNRDFARALQASLIGLPLLASPSDKAPFDTLVDTILALE
ncbi:Transcriptional regulatory protein [Sulfitobacter noctilucae]|uniref:TetR/AcrR family transcriptional regulator n=1 Tax=Sulfitobacter noctilucae TaxID=1342302 RepID=UPI00046A59E7|nr:TetR/AcrR family transcriptional regulator [Sulfitobacter noctilucae]KIN65265.1 Transcriptional regulatory protein [Sulfitobacter noctilucae]